MHSYESKSITIAVHHLSDWPCTCTASHIKQNACVRQSEVNGGGCASVTCRTPRLSSPCCRRYRTTVGVLIMSHSKNICFVYATKHYKFDRNNYDAILEKCAKLETRCVVVETSCLCCVSAPALILPPRLHPPLALLATTTHESLGLYSAAPPPSFSSVATAYGSCSLLGFLGIVAFSQQMASMFAGTVAVVYTNDARHKERPHCFCSFHLTMLVVCNWTRNATIETTCRGPTCDTILKINLFYDWILTHN